MTRRCVLSRLKLNRDLLLSLLEGAGYLCELADAGIRSRKELRYLQIRMVTPLCHVLTLIGLPFPPLPPALLVSFVEICDFFG